MNINSNQFVRNIGLSPFSFSDELSSPDKYPDVSSGIVSESESLLIDSAEELLSYEGDGEAVTFAVGVGLSVGVGDEMVGEGIGVVVTTGKLNEVAYPFAKSVQALT